MKPTPIKWTPKQVAAFWDFEQQKGRYHAQRFGFNILSYLRRDLRGVGSALDFGCGLGHMIEHLLPMVREAAGCEQSVDTIRAANVRLQEHPGFLGVFDTKTLLEEGRTFESVLLSEVIEHLDDEALASVFEAIRRLLVPGGLLIVTTPNAEDLFGEQVLCPHCRTTFHRWQHVRSWSGETLSRFLDAQGFRVTRVFAVDAGYPGTIKGRALKYLRNLLKEPLPDGQLLAVARFERPVRDK